MKIAISLPHMKIFGGIRRPIDMANQLIKNGHETVLVPSSGEKECLWTECNAKIKAFEEIKNKEFDVVIGTNADDQPNTLRIRAKIRIFYNLELYQRELLLNDLKLFLSNKGYLKKLKKIFKDKRLVFFSNSTWMHQWMKKRLGVKNYLLIGGVNRKLFHPVQMRPNKKIKILYNGDPRDRKGTQTIEESLAIVKQHYPNIQVESFFEKKLPQQKLAKTYSSADIFVDAQHFGGWNNPVIEAMACKTAVVCTNIGAVEDFAFHEKTALLVPIKNPWQMALSIERLIKDRKLREKLADAGYKQSLQFDWQKSIERFEQIITKIKQKKDIQ